MSSFERIRAPGLLALFVILFFFPALLQQKIFLYRDLFFFHYPLHHYWIAELSHGNLPFLNTDLNGGQPVLPNPSYSVFYPGNILFLLFPFNQAWNLLLIVHVYWAGLGLYWLCRRLGCNESSAFAGAVVFSFSGPLLSSLDYF